LKEPIGYHRKLRHGQLTIGVAIQTDQQFFARLSVHEWERRIELTSVKEAIAIPVELYKFFSVVLDCLFHRDPATASGIDPFELRDKGNSSGRGRSRDTEPGLAARDEEAMSNRDCGCSSHGAPSRVMNYRLFISSSPLETATYQY
jgi:hypothetical protein